MLPVHEPALFVPQLVMMLSMVVRLCCAVDVLGFVLWMCLACLLACALFVQFVSCVSPRLHHLILSR